MPNYLKFINELSVNGKPVEEDELDDDYTAETSDDDKGEQSTETELDLDPTPSTDEGEAETTQELDLDPSSDTEGGGESNDNNDDDTDDSIDDDYTIQAEDDGSSEPDSSESNQDDITDNNDDDVPSDGDEDNSNIEDNDASDGLDMDSSDDDYTQTGDSEGDEGQGDIDTNPDDDNPSDSVESPDSENPEEESLEDKIKRTESEIFNTLSDDEKAIKNKELIEDFIVARNTIKVFIEKVRTITMTLENKDILYFVESNLVSLNNIITNYILTRYSKKSYIENFVTYQQFVLTITQLKEIVSKLKIDDKKSQK